MAVRDKLRAMLADNKKASEIARECGVSRMAVYREQKASEVRSREDQP